MNKSIPPKPNNIQEKRPEQGHPRPSSRKPDVPAGQKSNVRAEQRVNVNLDKRPSVNTENSHNKYSANIGAPPHTSNHKPHAGKPMDGQNVRRSVQESQRTVKKADSSETVKKINSAHVNAQRKQDKAKNKKPSLLKRIGNSFSSVPSGLGKKNDFIKPTDIVRIKGSYDTVFLILVIVLTLFGLVMDFSASYAYAFNRFGDSFYFLKNQLRYAVVGFVAMFLAMKFDYKWVRKLTLPAFIVSILLLIGVLLYGFAAGVAQRWITIGPISFQPSEIAKLSLVLTLALYVARNQDRITNYRNAKQSNLYGMFIPFLIVAVICGLVALEKHFSGTIIIFAIGMVIIFAAGARISWFIAGGVAAVTALGIAITTVPYAIERLNMYRFPERYGANDELWQTLQGLYAVGSGGLFGVGLGNSRQKHLYVSQPQNDFVFSIIAEELGFAGAALVVILFMLLIWRGFVIALKAPDTFSSLIVIGLISKVAIQALLNIAVVTNMIPNTGISLPFFSYGGTALMMQLGEMGIILSISRFSYQRKDTLEA